MHDKTEKLDVRAWIYMQPGDSVFESSASFLWIENEAKHLPRRSFGKVFLQHRFNGN